ncbi:AAA family ATPase [Micrococcus luteus]|nr:AAA family ATPase [Micrococcus luteus]MCV7600555.1 AAA family ATPase [Micrococcus luteus]
MEIITFFNHKGGVAKTTNAFHLGWKLAEGGARVLLVDADSQCNLTGLAMGLTPPDVEDDSSDDEVGLASGAPGEFVEFQKKTVKFWEEVKDENIYSALAPVFNSEPVPLRPVECRRVSGNENLFLLPGSLDFASFESDLALAHSLQGSLGSQRNLPGAIYALLTRTGEALGADYLIVDVSPSLGAINQNIVAISDQVIIPCSPDYFSQMALSSLKSILPSWKAAALELSHRPQIQAATYPFPEPKFKFGGIVISRYVIYKKKPARAFRAWIDNVIAECRDELVPALGAAGLLFAEENYRDAGMLPDYTLAQVREFNSLRPKSQLYGVPTFALTKEQIGLKGRSLDNSLDQVEESNQVFSEFARKVQSLTGIA